MAARRDLSVEDLRSLPPATRLPGSALHSSLSQWLTALVAAGSLRVGDRLPAEREMAAALAVSRMTLRQALDDLERAGLVQKLRGRTGGVFISRPRLEVDLSGLPGLSHQVRQANLSAGSIVLQKRLITGPEQVCRALGLAPSAEVFQLNRIRLADGEPLAVEYSSFPAALFPNLLGSDLEGSIYEVLGAYGLPPFTAVERLESVAADPVNAAHLGVGEHSPLTRIERTAYAESGTPVEYSEDLFRSDRITFVITSRVDSGSRFDARHYPRGVDAAEAASTT